MWWTQPLCLQARRSWLSFRMYFSLALYVRLLSKPHGAVVSIRFCAAFGVSTEAKQR